MTARRRPRALCGGDRVAVVAPSGPVEEERLVRGCDLLTGWGLEVVLGEHVWDRDRFLAGTDVHRAADLVQAWTDPSVGAVVCARGGYGATRLLDRLDWDQLGAVEPKALVGSSDVTALHDVFGARLGLVTYFAPMPAGEGLGGPEVEPASAEHLRRTLFGHPVAPLRGTVTIRGGRATGRLTGGTLSMLAAGVGTSYAAPASGCIAVLEDVGEPSYRLDRMLTQLLHSGWFDGVRGVVLGSWESCGADALDVVGDRLGGLGVPVLGGLDVGHGAVALTLPLGEQAALDADARTLAAQSP